MKSFKNSIAAVIAVATFVVSPQSAVAEEEQFVPLLSYRIGPYAAGGITLFGGMIDYYNYVNKNGGVNGVQIVFEECETEYNVSKGIECYERLKDAYAGASIFETGSTGVAYALMDRAPSDKIPVSTVGYGRADSADGRVFPFVFPMIATYWSQADVMVHYLADEVGGEANLRGKTIVNLHHDSSYGKEGIRIFDSYAEKYDFNMIHIPVPSPGIDQQSQWSQIRAARPDYVILWGWGVMNPTALKAAQRAGFPATKIIGSWWAAAETDTIPAGDAAEGYRAMTYSLPGSFPLLTQIQEQLYANGEGNISKTSLVGSVSHVRGLIVGVIVTEAIRIAQEEFGVGKPVTGEQIQWALEHLKLDSVRQKELGIQGVIPELEVTCSNHEGSGQVAVQVWKDGKWELASEGWVEGDAAFVRSLVEEASAKYAAEHSITPRDCN